MCFHWCFRVWQKAKKFNFDRQTLLGLGEQKLLSIESFSLKSNIPKIKCFVSKRKNLDSLLISQHELFDLTNFGKK